MGRSAYLDLLTGIPVVGSVQRGYPPPGPSITASDRWLGNSGATMRAVTMYLQRGATPHLIHPGRYRKRFPRQAPGKPSISGR